HPEQLAYWLQNHHQSRPHARASQSKRTLRTPCHAMPCHAMPGPALPCPALPCPALLCQPARGNVSLSVAPACTMKPRLPYRYCRAKIETAPFFFFFFCALLLTLNVPKARIEYSTKSVKARDGVQAGDDSVGLSSELSGHNEAERRGGRTGGLS
ncbi:hypothetical protein BDZ91DRAFT_834097, partial [Kalaharituber pfeilii]